MSEYTREHIRNLVLILITTVIFIMQYYLISEGAYSAENMNQIISISLFSASGLTWCIVSGGLFGGLIFVFNDYAIKIKTEKSVKLFYPGWLWLLGTVVSIMAGVVAFYYCIGYKYIPESLQIGRFLKWNFSKIEELFQKNSQFELLCVIIMALLAAESFVWVIESIISYVAVRKDPELVKFSQTEVHPYLYGVVSWLATIVLLFPFFYGNIFGERTIWLTVISTVLVFVFGGIWFVISFFGLLEEKMEWKKVISYVPFWTVPSFVILFIWNATICKHDSLETITAGLEKIFVLREISSVIEFALFLTGISVVSMIISFLVFVLIGLLALLFEWVDDASKKIKGYEKKESEIEELKKKIAFQESELSRLNKEAAQHRENKENTREKYKSLKKEKDQLDLEMAKLRVQLENATGRERESHKEKDRNIQTYENKLIDKEYQIAQLKKSLEDAKNYATEMINKKSAEVDKLTKELQVCREKINQLSSGQSKNDAIQSMHIQKQMETRCEELEKEKERLEREVTNLRNNLESILEKEKKSNHKKDKSIQIYENKVKERDLQIAQLKKELEDAEKRALEVINKKNTEKKISSTQAAHPEQKSSTFLPFDVILTIHGMDADETVEGFWSHMGMDGKDKAVSQLHLDTLLGDIGIQTGLVLKGMDSVETAYGLKKAVGISGNTIVSVKKQGDITCMEPMEPFNWVLLKGIYDIVVKVENQAEITCMLELA